MNLHHIHAGSSQFSAFRVRFALLSSFWFRFVLFTSFFLALCSQKPKYPNHVLIVFLAFSIDWSISLAVSVFLFLPLSLEMTVSTEDFLFSFGVGILIRMIFFSFSVLLMLSCTSSSWHSLEAQNGYTEHESMQNQWGYNTPW
jgi:hypothetical protein